MIVGFYSADGVQRCVFEDVDDDVVDDSSRRSRRGERQPQRSSCCGVGSENPEPPPIEFYNERIFFCSCSAGRIVNAPHRGVA